MVMPTPEEATEIQLEAARNTLIPFLRDGVTVVFSEKESGRDDIVYIPNASSDVQLALHQELEDAGWKVDYDYEDYSHFASMTITKKG